MASSSISIPYRREVEHAHFRHRRWERRTVFGQIPVRDTVTKNRLEAFSDGVLAIIITIMVLELKVPHGEDLAALQPLLPVFLSYVLSFVYVGIY